MYKINVVIVLLLFSVLQLFAQDTEDRKMIKNATDVQQLRNIAREYLEMQQKFSFTRFNDSVDRPISGYYFTQFDKDGNPVYSTFENESSAEASKVDRIRTGGVSGLNLDGSGIVFGLWDSTPPRTTHQEYSGKINVVDPGTEGNHATHIAGMLIASGVDPKAKGMAPGATIDSYSTSGWKAEVAEWAANGGMISTHSYILANPKTEYTQYGIYNSYSYSWDELSYNAPYLIMCTGASNNGSQNYNPDGSRYDLLASNKLGKNSIVVGACFDVPEYTGPSSVEQAAFTSWGPTDDWRVKPDITAVGTNSYSSSESSDSAYASGQGCSYAGPVVAGGLALLQQHYHNLNDEYMKAATAKGLILSTTDEAGEYDGPDFANGWGLFNAEKAAEVISNNGTTARILELSLNDGETYTTQIKVDGTDTLTCTICWNDPPATPLSNAGTDDPTPMLINDLDIRVIGDDTTYKPWMLEPNSSHDNYTDAATKGDNYRDNIEIIEEKDIPAGEYVVSVSHKGSLQSGKQDFSLIINGVVAEVTAAENITLPQKEVMVYPMPVNNNVLNVVVKNTGEQAPFEVQLFNAKGQKVLVQSCSGTHSTLDVSTLPGGLYILSAVFDDDIVTHKVMIK